MFIISKETELAWKKKLLPKWSTGSDDFTGKFHQAFKEYSFKNYSKI
jgi:hypothetical protein